MGVTNEMDGKIRSIVDAATQKEWIATFVTIQNARFSWRDFCAQQQSFRLQIVKQLAHTIARIWSAEATGIDNVEAVADAIRASLSSYSPTGVSFSGSFFDAESIELCVMRILAGLRTPGGSLFHEIEHERDRVAELSRRLGDAQDTMRAAEKEIAKLREENSRWKQRDGARLQPLPAPIVKRRSSSRDSATQARHGSLEEEQPVPDHHARPSSTPEPHTRSSRTDSVNFAEKRRKYKATIAELQQVCAS